MIVAAHAVVIVRDGLPGVLTNPYLIAIVIPLILILSGGLAKKIVRGTSFQARDFFLGVELALATLGACLTNFFDLTKAATAASGTAAPGMTGNATFLAFSFFLLLIILATHQEWEAKTQNPKGQLFWLGFFSNTVGAGLMIAFILMVKGV